MKKIQYVILVGLICAFVFIIFLITSRSNVDSGGVVEDAVETNKHVDQSEENNAIASNGVPTNQISNTTETVDATMLINVSSHIDPVVDQVALQDTNVEDVSLDEMTVFIRSAGNKLKSMNVPFENREPRTKIDGQEVIVTFPPEQGKRAGSFIVRIDRETGEVIDTIIWR